MSDGEEFEALWPGGVCAVQTVSPAPRIDLPGKRIGFLWGDMFRGDEIFQMLQRNLTERFDSIEYVNYDRFGPIFGGDEHSVVAALPNRLKKLGVDAVISGIGC